MGNWLENIRDRVVVRSQVGKRKLDAVFMRRELDRKFAELGQAFLNLVREGRASVPPDIAVAVSEARKLEERLELQRSEIAALKSEAV